MEDFEELLDVAAIFLVIRSTNVRNCPHIAPATRAVVIGATCFANVCAILNSIGSIAPGVATEAIQAFVIVVAWSANIAVCPAYVINLSFRKFCSAIRSCAAIHAGRIVARLVYLFALIIGFCSSAETGDYEKGI